MSYANNGVPLASGRPFVINEIQYPANVLDLWSRADLEALGLVWVDPPVDPEPTLDDLRATANAAVNAKREAVFEAGYPVASGPLVGQHLQLRSADDKANWLIAEKNARAAIAAGAGDVAMIPTRTLENNTLVLTPHQTVAVLSGLEAWGLAVMDRSWALKDRNDAATDISGLVDDEMLRSGWP